MQGATPELLQPGARMLRHGGGRKARMLELWRWPDAARAPPLGAQMVMKCELPVVTTTEVSRSTGDADG